MRCEVFSGHSFKRWLILSLPISLCALFFFIPEPAATVNGAPTPDSVPESASFSRGDLAPDLFSSGGTLCMAKLTEITTQGVKAPADDLVTLFFSNQLTPVPHTLSSLSADFNCTFVSINRSYLILDIPPPLGRCS